jgi:hypothetical protein
MNFFRLQRCLNVDIILAKIGASGVRKLVMLRGVGAGQVARAASTPHAGDPTAT